MESCFKARTELINIIEKIRDKNNLESCLTAFTIIKSLAHNIISNPSELKYRIIKKTNATVKKSLLNINCIENLLLFLCFEEKSDYYEMGIQHIDKCQITIGVLEFVLFDLEAKIKEKEAGKSYLQNPEAMKEKAKIEKKRKEEADERERVKRLIDNDKKERLKRMNKGI